MKTLLGAATLALTTAAPVAAAPINLDFSFGGVTGTFYGLDNADGTSSATSFDLFGVLDSYVGVDASTSPANSFEFSGGILVDVDFMNITPQIGIIPIGEIIEFETAFAFASVTERNVTTAANTITSASPTFTQAPVSVVPLPAGLPLLLAGLGGLALLRKRKAAS